MSEDDHIPNFGFVQQAFLNSVMFLLTHPVTFLRYGSVGCALYYFVLLYSCVCECISIKQIVCVDQAVSVLLGQVASPPTLGGQMFKQAPNEKHVQC